MSKLEELIKELCPNGVEYKTLGEFATVIRGGNFQKKDFVETGKPCIHYGQMYTHFKNTTDKTLTFVSDKVFNKSKQAQPNDIVMAVTSENVDDVCSCVAWLGKENIAVSGHTAIIHHNQNPSYMSYYFHSEHFYKQKVRLAHGTKVIEVTPDKLLNIQIPVPPLPVQEEVVRILNKFTSLTAELTAELTARRKQYEYYRDSLLTRDTKVEHKKLNEIAEIYDGTHQTPEYKDSGIPFISVENIDDIYSSKKFISNEAYNQYKIKPQLGDLFMTRIGSIGKCAVMNKEMDLAYYVSLALIRPNQQIINTRYLKHFIESTQGKKELSKRTLHHAVPIKVNKDDVGKIEIAFPTLEIQERIVNVLDNFDSICTDLKIGLPAEIEARKKQYEYYRDLLLTFASSGNTILSEQNRTEQNRTDEIKLLQYVFGYAIVRLGEIATDIYRGAGITRDQVTTDGISCVRYGEIYTTYGIWFDKCVSHTHLEDIPSRKYFEHGDILFAITGESVEDIAKSTAYVGDEKCLVGGDIVVMKHKQNPKFLSYVLSTTDAQKQKGKGKVKSKVVHSSVPAISEITIPLPTLEEQERIVKILDRFDSLCNDISSGLPAEIEARQKQYEYYRDKLLTFDRIEA